MESEGKRLPDALFAGRQGRLVFAYLVCERGRSVPREELAELLWGERLPASWSTSLSAVVSKLRRLLTEAGLEGADALPSAFGSYRLHLPNDAWVDWEVATARLDDAEHALREAQSPAAVAAARDVEDIARLGFITDDCVWVDAQRERLRDLHVRAVQTRAEAHLLVGEAGRAVAAAREALDLDELREATFRLVMRALAAAGERGEALRVWERCRAMLGEELGTDPAPETEAVYLQILRDTAPQPSASALPSGVLTFLLTDIVDSSGLWEREPAAMSQALERHDQLVGAVVERHGGVLLKAKLEGDATVSVFRRASDGVSAALALQEAFAAEDWPAGASPGVRMALHTGEAIERAGDYFGPALNRAARLRALAGGGQVLLSQAVAEVVRDNLPEGAFLRSLGERALRGLSRNEHVFELGWGTDEPDTTADTATVEPRALPSVLRARGPFVGREPELAQVATEWATALAGTPRAVFIAGEPGVGKTRLAAEAAQRAHADGALVLYGRCEEELGAPYQPFTEALRALVGHLGQRLKSVRGIEELARLVPELGDVLPGLPSLTHSDPDTERYVLFDALVRLFTAVSADIPILIVVDDLHWAAKPTLLLLRHILRSAESARILIVGTYRQTDLDRSHPLAAALADLHRDGAAERITLGGLDADDVAAYVSAVGHDDEHLGAALAGVTSGNPFFLIEVLRHVEESGGAWDPTTLPQGVREAVGRRLSRLSDQANEALLVGAIAGSRFSLDLIERVVEADLVDAIDEARRAGLVVEEGKGGIRFNHALVRQSLLSEVASVRRIRCHQRIAEALEADPTSATDAHLADLARHYFECAWAGGAVKAVDYSRRAGEQAMARLAFEEAADLFDRALQAAEVDSSEASAEDKAELLLARCEALLAAGDPTAAAVVVDQLDEAAATSPRLAAWATCFAGQLAVLTHPERLDKTAIDVAAAAERFAELGDADGEATAHTVRASCLARLGRIADSEVALDKALTAGRRAGDPRRINAVLAGAPLAALWGPSPVARASGRCLDVVRVLRITTGSAAVEAVALRSQAVLEALRGRTEAARRMLSSAHRSLEGLGHRHGLLETDLFAGMVELIAGNAAAAEVALRRAAAGFTTRGIGVDAAQATALLARAVLAQGRVDEAITLTEDSQRLAGVDRTAEIAWRSARAEALAQRGEVIDAVELARSAASLADASDALIDQADAHLSLAVVLARSGQSAESEREARRSIELYDRKGATARVEAVALLLEAPARAEPEGSPPIAAAGDVHGLLDNVAARSVRAFNDALAEGDRDAITRLFAEDVVVEDRRRFAQLTFEGRQAAVAGSLAVPRPLSIDWTVLATRGEFLALCRDKYESSGGELAIISVYECDRAGRHVRRTHFEPDDLDAAFAELDARFIARGEASPEWQVSRDATAAAHAQQWETFAAFYNDDAVTVDHRSANWGTQDVPGIVEVAKAGVTVTDRVAIRFTAIVRQAPGVLLALISAPGEGPEGGTFEWEFLTLATFRSRKFSRIEIFPVDALSAAFGRFDELAATPVDLLDNEAARTCRAIKSALLAPDVGRLFDLVAADASFDDRRPLVGASVRGQRDVVDALRGLGDVGVTAVEQSVVATRGEKLVLRRDVFRGASGEVTALFVNEVDEDGRVSWGAIFAPDDLDAAFAELDGRYLAGPEVPVPDEWRMTLDLIKAGTSRQWDVFAPHMSEDFAIVDHRPASWGTLDAGGLMQVLRAGENIHASVVARTLAVVRHVAGAALSLIEASGSDAEGGTFENRYLALGQLRDHQMVRVEMFPVDDLSAALRRFEALAESRDESYLRNMAFRRQEAVVAAVEAGDFERYGSMVTDDAVSDDRRLTGSRVEGREAHVAMLRGVVEVDGVTEVCVTPLATRGEQLALVYLRAAAPGASAELDMLVVGEYTPDGRIAYSCVLEPGAFDDAFGELDARYLAGEGAGDSAFGASSAVFAAFNARDWDAALAALAADYVLVDHRATGWGTLDGPGFVATIRGVIELTEDVRTRHVAALRYRPDATVTVVGARGSNATGGVFEIEIAMLTVSRGGLVARQEFFAIEDLDAAYARLDELEAPPDYLRNTATMLVERNNALSLRGDLDAYAEAIAEDVVIDDRRLTGVRTVGRGAAVELAEAVRAVGVTDSQVVPVAVRGDRLAMCRVLLSGPGGEVETLGVYEVTEEGLFCYGRVFEPYQLEDAYAELNARYLAGEGAPFAESVGTVLAGFDIYRTRDFDAYRRMLDDDFVGIDHRLGGWGSLDRDGWVTMTAALFEVVAELRGDTAAILRATADAAMSILRATATDASGGTSEFELVNLQVVRAGQIVRVELWAIEDMDAAVARFEELTAPAVHSYLRNQAVKFKELVATRWRDRDVEWLRAFMADDVVHDDRRLTGTRSVGRDRLTDVMQSVWEMGATEFRAVPIATRGEQLALSRDIVSGPASEVETLSVLELNADGQQQYVCTFEPHDLGAAYSELDARYLAGEGAPFAESVTLLLAGFDVYRSRDFDAYRRIIDEEFVAIDYRLGGWGTLDRDGFVTMVAGMFDVVAELRADTAAILRAATDMTMGVLRATCTDMTGGTSEFELVVLHVGCQGKLLRHEMWAVEDLDAAIARFDELAASRTPSYLRNDAVVLHEQAARCMRDGNLARWAEVIADDTVHDDRRLTGTRSVGRDRLADVMRSVAGAGVTDCNVIPIATRGQQLALLRDIASGSHGEVEVLSVVELNSAGKQQYACTFEPDDLDAAYAELDARYLAGELASRSHTFRLVLGVLGGYAAEDPAELERWFADDFEMIDHRLVGWGTLDRAGTLDMVRGMVELRGDLRPRLAAVLRLDDGGGVLVLRATGTDPVAGAVEFELVNWYSVRGGQFVRQEFFAVGDLHLALAQFDERTGPAVPEYLDNDAFRRLARIIEAFLVDAWDDLAGLVAPDAVLDDRRSLVASRSEGRDGFVSFMRSFREIGVVGFDTTPIATRGDRLLLIRNLVSTDGAEVESVNVGEFDADGKALGGVSFDPGDLDAAFAELDARYVAGEGAPYAALLKTINEAGAAYNRSDWAAWESHHSADWVFIDHRPSGWGRLDRDQYLATIQSLIDSPASTTVRLIATVALRPSVALLVLNDGAFETDVFRILGVRDGQLVHEENFAIQDIEAARARFEELAAPDVRQYLENDATRGWAKVTSLSLEHDWAGVRACVSPGGQFGDRRRIVGGHSFGRDGWVATFREAMSYGVARVDATTVATRGASHALIRNVFWGQLAEVEILELVEADGAGLLAAVNSYDPANLDKALQDLDERYLAGEGAPFADSFSVLLSVFSNRVGERPVEELPLSPNYVWVDHRVGGWGTFGRETLAEMARGFLELGTVLHSFVGAVIEITQSGALVLLRVPGTDAAGGAFEFEFLVVVVTDGGRVARTEPFDLDDLDAARARFAELTAEAAAPLLQNEATRLWAHLVPTLEDHDWEELASLILPEASMIDRRPIVGGTAVRGADIVRLYRQMNVDTMSWRPMASRGDRLLLAHNVMGGALGEVEFLEVIEVDDRGRWLTGVAFDVTDFDAALADLEQRYMAAHPAFAQQAQSRIDNAAAYSARDWDAYSRGFTDDFVLVDHRAAGWRTLDRDGFIAVARGMTDLAPDVRQWVEAVVRQAPDATVTVSIGEGTNERGGRFEVEMVAINMMRGDQAYRVELFPVEAFEAAVARFEEVTSADG